MSIYLPGGKALIVGGKFCLTADDCCCVNCTLNCASLPGSVSIEPADFSGTLAGCVSGAFSDSLATWTTSPGNSGCNDLTNSAYYETTETRVVDGVLFGDLYVYWNSTNCEWVLTITDVLGGAGTIWQGTLAGSNPVGTYTRTGGCSTLATLVVS